MIPRFSSLHRPSTTRDSTHQPAGSLRHAPLAMALHLAMAGSALGLVSWHANVHAQPPAPNQNPPTMHSHDIPAGPLNAALTRFAGETGILLAGHAGLVQGRSSPGLKGRHTVQGGFAALLAGTGLEAFRQADGSYGLRPAPAADLHGDTTLAPMTVTARAERDGVTEGTGAYTSATASLMKGVTSLKDIPQTVSIITRQRMDDQNLDTLEKALEVAPGIYKDSSGRGAISGKDSDGYYYSRGYMISTYMLDGVAVEGIFAPNRDGTPTSTISGSSALYDRMEILRGAAGLLVGAGQPGGTVNLVRKRPTSGFQQRYQASAGAWNNRHFQADISGPLNEAGNLRGRLVADYTQSDRPWNYADTSSEAPMLYGILDFDITPGTRIGLGMRYEKYKENASPRLDFQTDWGYKDSEDKEVFVDLKHHFSPRWQLNATVAHRVYDLDFLTAVIFNPFASNWRADIQARQHKITTDSLDLSLLGRFDLFGREHRITLGFNGSDETMRPRTSGTLTIPQGQMAFNPYDYRHDIWPDRGSSVVQNLIGNTRNGASWLYTRSHGAYGKLEARLRNDLTAVIGARASTYRIDGSNYQGVKDQYGSDAVSAFTPYAGLIYAVSPSWSAYASYADIFRPQFDKWTRDGQRVDHVVGANYELGVKGELFGGKLNTALALFRIDEKNSTQAEAPPYDQVCPGNPRYPTLGGCVIATGHKRSQGLDAEISGEWLPGWQVSAAYTYLTSKVLKADVGAGKPIVGWRGSSGPVTPKHLFKLYSSHHFRDGMLAGLTIGGGGTFQSQQMFYSSVATQTKWTQGSRAIWDTFARYQISKQYAVSLNINNVFDKKYFLWAPSSPIINDSIYGTPRSWTLTFSARY